MVDYISRNFLLSEFACPCCGIYNYRQATLDKIQMLRDFYGKSIVPSSVCRCIAHNRNAGGSGNSHHLAEGKEADAIDIPYSTKEDAWRIAKLAFMLDFKGVILYSNHIHLDDRSIAYFSLGVYSTKK